MEERPKLKVALSKVDKVLESVCLTTILILWVGTFAFFFQLPQQIPSHFNAVGQADDFSNRIHIFELPVVATILYIGMTILNRYTHIYNYATTVTAENARRLYTAASRLIRVLKLMVVIIFSSIVFMTIRASFENGSGLGAWFLPIAIGLMILPNIFYLFKSSNAKKSLC